MYSFYCFGAVASFLFQLNYPLNRCSIVKSIWDMFANKHVMYKKDANKQIANSSDKQNQM